MLQKWKRKGKRFRHVEKDGEETTELSVKIRAAKFRDLPMSLRILIVNLSLFLILCAVFFMAGAYLYAPQAAGRNYVEACLAGDWNSAYDVCQFPDSTFLSRKNYVNAMTWKAKQDGTDGQETPEIKSFFMRRKQNLETGENRIYTVRYTLKGMSDSQEETLEIAAGDTVKWNFKEWYVVPKDSCVTDVEITVPADASFYLDGVQVGKKYLKETADNVSIYKIPYLFLGGHTIELTEKQKDPYREIVLVQDNSSMEFLPDLKLNDSTGKTIADRAEESLDKVFTAAAAGKSFSTIKNEFSADIHTWALPYGFQTLQNLNLVCTILCLFHVLCTHLDSSCFFVKHRSLDHLEYAVCLKMIFDKLVQSGTGNQCLYAVNALQKIILPTAVQFRQNIIQQ